MDVRAQERASIRVACRSTRPAREDAYRERLSQLYDQTLLAMPGAAEMLASLPNPKCVASNCPLSKMAHGLRVTDLEKFFGDRIFSAYQVGHWKPAPHLFLHAARAMNYPPAMCIVVEDSDAGLHARISDLRELMPMVDRLHRDPAWR